MERTFCSGCGVEVPMEPGTAVPLCRACRPTSGVPAGWMVRRPGQRPQGPLQREVVEDWVCRGVVDRADEVARIDGSWSTFDVHEDFRGWFTPGDPRCEQRLRTIKGRRGEASRARVRRRMGETVRVLVALGVVGGAAWAGWNRLTVVPEPWVDAGVGVWRDVTGSFLATVEKATSEEQAGRVMAARAELPGEDVLARLIQEVPDDRRPARLHYLLGRSSLMDAVTEAPADAVRELEQAFVASPRDGAVVAALAEIYSLRGRHEAARADDAVALLSRAEALAPGSVDVLRARLAAALVRDAAENALEVAGSCLAIEPENLHCAYYKGLALVATERWVEAEAVLQQVHDAAPHVPRFKLALCQAAVEAGHYAYARDRVDAFQADHQQVAEGFALSARLAWLTGDWHRARKEAAEAVALDASRLESRLLAAELELAVGSPARARELLAPALEDPTLGAHRLAPRVLRCASHVARALGDTLAAAEHARRSLEGRDPPAAAAHALSLALVAAGDLKGAEEATKSVEPDGLSAADAGRFFTQLGRVYQAQGRSKAALTAFEAALDKDPSCWTARVGVAECLLDLGDVSRSLEALETIVTTEYAQRENHPPNVACPIPPADLRGTLATLRKAITDDVRLAGKLAVAEGIVAYHGGEPDIAEGRFRRALSEDENSSTALAYLARIQFERGQWAAAEETFARLLSAPGHEGLNSSYLGLARVRGGRVAEGIPLLERVVPLQPLSPSAHRFYAEALFAAGNPEKAREQALAAVRLDPLDHAARRLLLTEEGSGR